VNKSIQGPKEQDIYMERQDSLKMSFDDCSVY